MRSRKQINNLSGEPSTNNLFNLGVARTLAWVARRHQPQTSGTLRVDGLDEPVEVLWDHWGVPHIYAEDLKDLFFAQGYVHAHERLWQMDFQRRLVAGRLSEVLGAVSLAADRWMRTLGMRRVAEAEPGVHTPESLAYLEAYTRGVNAFIAGGRFPVEFALLRYQPEPWSMVDSLSWVKMLHWALSVNWESELLRSKLIQRLGLVREAELEPPYRPEWPTILTDQEADANPAPRTFVEQTIEWIQHQVIDGTLEKTGAANHFTGPKAGAGLGSNNWAISGERSATGMPFLANDMHLNLGAPAIWFENHLNCDGLNVTGVTFPGIPGVVAGHNEHVGWGFTNGFADVQDLFNEHLRKSPDGGLEYEYCGEWLPAQVTREEIRIKGQASETLERVQTRHGPVISDLPGQNAGGQALALRWTAFEPVDVMSTLLAVNQAADCHQMREAISTWKGPVQNVVFADTRGNIAYNYAGLVPVRARGDGSVPVPGWGGDYEWTGYVSFKELPALFNPGEGYIVTANNRVTRGEYRHPLGGEFCSGNRAARIVELLQAQPKVDLAYTRRMQFDQVSILARMVAKPFQGLVSDNPRVEQALAQLRGWDGDLAADSAAAAIYQVFVRILIRRLLAARLGDLTESYTGKGPIEEISDISMFGEKAMDWLLNVLDDPHSQWYDLGDGVGADRDAVLLAVLAETVDFLSSALGPRVAGWAWGKLHHQIFSHYLGVSQATAAFFNRGPYAVGGDATTIWATASLVSVDDWKIRVGPPFRFIADLSDLNHCLAILAPGNSGHPSSPHYDDQVSAWFDGSYHPMLFNREEIVRKAEQRMALLPVEEGEP